MSINDVLPHFQGYLCVVVDSSQMFLYHFPCKPLLGYNHDITSGMKFLSIINCWAASRSFGMKEMKHAK